ncbi:MAG: hypothetical protein Q7K55_06695 [Candidatus Levybacteria bacterium]|nr:hypothetical protein [Candidatus Levybacteria bacterium]
MQQGSPVSDGFSQNISSSTTTSNDLNAIGQTPPSPLTQEPTIQVPQEEQPLSPIGNFAQIQTEPPQTAPYQTPEPLAGNPLQAAPDETKPPIFQNPINTQTSSQLPHNAEARSYEELLGEQEEKLIKNYFPELSALIDPSMGKRQLEHALVDIRQNIGDYTISRLCRVLAVSVRENKNAVKIGNGIIFTLKKLLSNEARNGYNQLTEEDSRAIESLFKALTERAPVLEETKSQENAGDVLVNLEVLLSDYASLFAPSFTLHEVLKACYIKFSEITQASGYKSGSVIRASENLQKIFAVSDDTNGISTIPI